jgi:thioredoxin 1
LDQVPKISGNSQNLGNNGRRWGDLLQETKNSETLYQYGFQRDRFHGKKMWHAGWLYWNAKTKKMNRAISKMDFQKEVLEGVNLSLVHFKTEWSGACQIITPMFEELAYSYEGQAKFFTVDVEREKGIDDDYGIIELPTILFFKSGRVIDHLKGLAPKNVMISKIENALTTELN